jgi:ubiquinone/menaquinone biosynthesis C-methylase UbiE
MQNTLLLCSIEFIHVILIAIKNDLMVNKVINRENTSATKIFDDRTLAVDYRTLPPILKPGMKILDVGCGTGSITRDIAAIVGPSGKVIGIDNTEKFITAGKENFADVKNMELIATDLFQFEPKEQFDLIVSARTMQWLSNVPVALIKMKSMLKPGGILSVLDYNHKKIEWTPQPPAIMKKFYAAFLAWREHAGINNQVADDLPQLFNDAGLKNIETLNADEHYRRGEENFEFRVGIWSKVGLMAQISEEGFISEAERLQSIEEYDAWVASEAQSMLLRLNEVRGVN